MTLGLTATILALAMNSASAQRSRRANPSRGISSPAPLSIQWTSVRLRRMPRVDDDEHAAHKIEEFA
jgi:hypothetical protein